MPDRKIEWVNDSFKLFGYDPDWCVGKKTEFLYKDRNEFLKSGNNLKNAIAEGKELINTEALLKRKNSEIFPAEITVTVYKEKSKIVSVTGVVRDISERRQAEKMKQAKETAETANHAKSTFLANMSHELRTPLNAVLGFSQILSHGQNLTKEQQKHLRIINSSGEHLLTLINSVLDMSKIDAGRVTLNETGFDLYQMLDDLENMLHMRTQKKGLELIFEHTPDVPRYIRTDETKLRQVLINLLNNAVKFTKQGGIQLSVNGSAALRGGKCSELIPDNSLLFTVKDTGPGIAPEEMDSLFNAFVQTETGRASQEGTGLGLPISRKFVQMMGGDITVSSRPGIETTFRFNIRVSPAEISDIRQPVTVRRVTALEPGQPRYRILIVDDNPDNRHLLVTLLNPLGFELREAENGEQAVKIWEEWGPHLIWMDMWMPVMNGYEAVRKIKETAKGQATAVIAVTAGVFEEERSLVMSAGCDDFLRKPFRESDIFELMEKHTGIRFVYEQENREEKTGTAAANALTKDALASIPSELTEELRNAAILGDVDKVDFIITSIRSHNKPLADALAIMAEEFEFDKILEFIQENKDIQT